MSRLIVNADDFGISLEVNQGISECFRQHIVDRTTVMVNMPYAQDAMQLARKEGFLSAVGLHINLTEGKPLTDKIKTTKFCNTSGLFSQGGRATFARIYLDGRTKEAVREEVAAQCQKFLELGGILMHADSHQHIHTSISLVNVILKVLKKYGFQSIRLSRNIPISQITGAKKIYKNIVNNRFRKFNAKYSKNNMIIDYFGNMDDVECFLSNEASGKENVEAMTHPGNVVDGVVYDILNKKNIAMWEERVKKQEL